MVNKINLHTKYLPEVNILIFSLPQILKRFLHTLLPSSRSAGSAALVSVFG